MENCAAKIGPGTINAIPGKEPSPRFPICRTAMPKPPLKAGSCPKCRKDRKNLSFSAPGLQPARQCGGNKIQFLQNRTLRTAFKPPKRQIGTERNFHHFFFLKHRKCDLRHIRRMFRDKQVRQSTDPFQFRRQRRTALRGAPTLRRRQSKRCYNAGNLFWSAIR